MNMKKNSLLILPFVILILIFTVVSGCAKQNANQSMNQTLRLATTTSTVDSGLLDYLLPFFEDKYDIKVDVLAQGTGQALKTAELGDADIILVHARAAEDKFVADGYGVKRFDVMYNDFVLVGPEEDPAKIKGMSVQDALMILSSGESKFISRGDDSGTHKMEVSLWEKTGIQPQGDWYLSIGKGMGDTLIMTNEQQGYTLTDRATYLFMKNNINLSIVVEGEKELLNPYGVIAVNPKKHPDVNVDGAQKLIDFLLSDEGQQLISEYRVNDMQLFFTYQK